MIKNRSELKNHYDKKLKALDRSIQKLKIDLANAKTQFDQSIYRDDLYRLETEHQLRSEFLNDLTRLEILD